MENSGEYIEAMNTSMFREYKDAFDISINDPSMALFISKMIRYQRKAEKKRKEYEMEGLHVPPIIIASITNRCNLHCKGCYAIAQKRRMEEELPSERWETLSSEASELGISVIMLAGGEPFIRIELLDLAGKFKEIIFPVFTNGTLLNTECAELIKKHRNIIPVLSIEGFENETDNRRGRGIYEIVQNAIENIRSKCIFFGVSITVTSKNYSTVTDNDFIAKLINEGCKLFFFVEYVPVEEGTEDFILDTVKRKELGQLMEKLQSKFPGIFIAFPGDEEKFGGCLAAGRGFIHVSPSGRIEPCPFAPYSDKNIKEISLKDALNSKLLEKIRQSHDKLTETRGGCSLWTNKEWVQSLTEDK